MKEEAKKNMDEFFDKSKALQIILDKAYNKGISQSKLIEGIYDYSHFNRMCNGKESIKLDILVLCCIKLDISFDQVIQLSKEKALLELDEYYNQFEIIRLKRNFTELTELYKQIISNEKVNELNKYKQLSTHILAIIEAQKNHNFNVAKSLLEPSHILIWDEPLNYIDIFSRIQIEELILQYKPTMIFIEHDSYFYEKIKTKEIVLKKF